MQDELLTPGLSEDDRRQRLAALVDCGAISSEIAARIQFRQPCRKVLQHGLEIIRRRSEAVRKEDIECGNEAKVSGEVV